MTALAGTEDEPRTRVLERAAAGDEVAFARIVQAHHADLAKVCYFICGDLDTAEDAAAAAWAIAWRKIGTIRDPERLRPWLVSIAANEARQNLRRQRRRRLVEVSVTDAGLSNMASSADGPRDLDLVNALARLAPDDRTLLALRYVAGLNATDLGRATGRSASGTRARIARLLGRLRLELGDD
jgi:RNA polymerase sigma factor (sigma-70 family)